METSGAMVLAFTEQAHKELNRAFENRLVQKKYEAYLDGILEKSDGMLSPKKGEKSGEIKLKFRLDVDNRPHQIYDEVYGKEGITLWQNCGVVIYKNPCTNQSKKVTKVIYTPLTGRTHQLRLVSSDMHGFNLPIIGDTLYGHCEQGQRLMLHAFYLSFNHPITGELMEFTVPFSDSSL
jgi:tRNA pseudouridine32 synthase/23S rRNA pseudouridine746 synthase